MKKTTRHIANYFVSLVVLLAIFVFGCGCNTPKPAPDPLVGWRFCLSQDPNDLDKLIAADYQDYLQKLPPVERSNLGYIHTFEDGNGQHAIRIEVFENGKNASWHYALIYDKENKRIKIVKYDYRKYQS